MSSTGSGLFTKRVSDKPHLEVGTPVGDLRGDIVKETAVMAAIAVEEYTNPIAASATAIKTAIATVAAATTYSGADLNGSIGAGVIPEGRNITITTAGVTPADAPATAVINGTYRGKAQTETITVAQTATIATGVKCFDRVTSIVLPAADGVAATLSFGIGSMLGTRRKPMGRAGGVNLVREVAVGSLVTNGVLTAEGYTPNTVPNGTNDYCIYYEWDATDLVSGG